MEYDLTDYQIKTMRLIQKHSINGSVQVAGYKMAPVISSCHALVRKGYLFSGSRTGHFGITNKGHEKMKELIEPITKEQK